MRRDVVVAMVLAGAALGAWLLTRSLPPAAPGSALPQSANPPSTSAASAADPVPAPAPSATSTPATASSWKPEDAPAVVAQRFRDAKDRRAFYDQALRTGGGAHLHFAALAYGACQVVQGGAVAMEQRFLSQLPSSAPNYAERHAALRESLEKCRGFEGFPFSGEMSQKLYEQKYAYGDPLSLAARLVRPAAPVVTNGEAVRAAQRTSARELLAGGDPYVFMELYPLASRAQVPSAACIAAGKCAALEDSFNEARAWRLVAIDNGMYDAEEDLRLVACAWLGECKPMTPVDFVRREGGMTPAQVDRILARRDQIADAYRRKDWAGLGF